MKHAAPRAPRSMMPPLPADLARQITAGLRSPRPMRKRQTIDAMLAARAFAAGFVQGADSERARRRHAADRDDEHWLRGYHAGQLAAAEAAARYLADRLCRGAQPAPPGAPRTNVVLSGPGPRSARPDAPPSPQLTLF